MQQESIFIQESQIRVVDRQSRFGSIWELGKVSEAHENDANTRYKAKDESVPRCEVECEGQVKKQWIMGRRKKVSVPKELWYKTENSQPPRIRSMYARIDPLAADGRTVAGACVTVTSSILVFNLSLLCPHLPPFVGSAVMKDSISGP